MFKLSQIPARYVGLALLCPLTLAYLALFRFDLFGIDEGAARGLLLNWSIGSQMLSPVAILGFPDLRALLLSPLNLHWVGDLTAAKVYTMFLTFATGLMIYRWAEEKLGEETALFATGLWLISPLTISQVDSIGAGNYLVLTTVVIYWMEKHFRNAPQVISGFYFILLLLAALAISMHPAGLGIAVALAWSWVRDSGDKPKKRNMLILGMFIMGFFVLVSRLGWPEITLVDNPLPALAMVLSGPTFGEPSTALAVLAAVLFALAAFSAIRRKAGLFSSMLMFGAVFGLLAPNSAWAELLLVVILYEGLHALMALNSKFGSSPAARRSLVAVAVLLLSTSFMLMDKQRYYAIHSDKLSSSDQLIAALGELDTNPDPNQIIASQWPGRTMLATRRGALPLPPIHGDLEIRELFLRQTRGISYMIFDHRDKRNAALVRQISSLSDIIKTEAVLPGGVIVKMPSADEKKKEPKAKS